MSVGDITLCEETVFKGTHPKVDLINVFLPSSLLSAVKQNYECRAIKFTNAKEA